MSPLDLIEVNITLGILGCVLFYAALRVVVHFVNPDDPGR